MKLRHSNVLQNIRSFNHSRQVFFSRRALAQEGDYEMMPVCACVHVGVRAFKCVTQISPKLLQLQIFCKLIVPMNFHALEIFFGFMDLGLKINE